MTALTPIYGLKYLVQGEPARNTRQALEDNAYTIEAALQARGVAAVGASDLLAVSGRVSVLEGAAYRPGKKLWKTGTQSIGNAWVPLTWESRDTLASSVGVFSSANTSRLVAPKAGRYRVTAVVPYNIATSGNRHLMIRSNSAGNSSAGVHQAAAVNTNQAGMTILPLIADEVVLAAGEYVEAFALSSVAATPVGTQSGYEASFTLSWIGVTA